MRLKSEWVLKEISKIGVQNVFVHEVVHLNNQEKEQK